MGRKSKYESHVKPFLTQISEWILDYDEAIIAKEKLGIGVSTFENYKNKYPELREALKNGRLNLVSELKMSLRKKARGYYYEETKEVYKDEDGKITRTTEKYKKYAQPDVGAIHLLLKNLDPEWTNDDKTTIEIKKQQIEIAKQKAENAEW